MPSITIVVQLGALVRVEIEGETATEIADALHGFERLNKAVDAMFSDLAERVYPDGDQTSTDAAPTHAGKKEA